MGGGRLTVGELLAAARVRIERLEPHEAWAAVAAGDRAAAEAVFEAAVPHFRERHAQRLAGREIVSTGATAEAEPPVGAASAAIG